MPDRSVEPEQESNPAAARSTPAGRSLLAHRMSLLVRGAGFLLGMVVTVGAALFLFISASFSDAEIATDLSDYVEMAYERTLGFERAGGEADVELVLWPWPALKIGPASLSEPNRAKLAASWKNATLELDLLELLRHRLVIRHAQIDGLALSASRNRDGRWSLADLFETVDEEPDDVALALQLEGLNLSGARLVVDDAMTGRSLSLDDMSLSTDALRPLRSGRLQLAAQMSAGASLNGKLTASANYRFEDNISSGEISKAQTTYVGGIGGLKTAELTLSAGAVQWRDAAWTLGDLHLRGESVFGTRTLALTAALPEARWQGTLQARNASAQLEFRGGTPADMHGQMRLALHDLAPEAAAGSTARLELTCQMQGKDRAVDASLAGRLRVDAKSTHVAFSDITGDAALTHPALRTPATRLRLSGSGGWWLGQTAGAPLAEFDMAGTFGEEALHLAGRLAAGAKDEPPALSAQLDTKAFDVDALLAPGMPLPLPDADVLKGWTLEGLVQAENLHLAGVRVTSARVPVRIADGTVSLPAHVLQLYGGKSEGSLAYDAVKKELNVLEVLRDVQLGDLAQDGKLPVPLAGAANATIDVRSTGATWREFEDNARGGVRLYAKDARWLGVDLPRAMLALNAGSAPPDAASATTPLSEVFVAFKVAGSQLDVDKLTARSAALSMSGSGAVDYAKARMDLKLDARLAAGKSFAPIAGKRMALRVNGPAMQPLIQLAGEATKPPH